MAFSYDGSGTYKSAGITGISAGTYDIYVKGWAHLQRKFQKTITAGSTVDLTEKPLLTGNADGNNVVNVQDFNVLKAQYWQTGTLTADFNLDTIVNIQDFRFLGENYFQEDEQP